MRRTHLIPLMALVALLIASPTFAVDKDSAKRAISIVDKVLGQEAWDDQYEEVLKRTATSIQKHQNALDSLVTEKTRLRKYWKTKIGDRKVVVPRNASVEEVRRLRMSGATLDFSKFGLTMAEKRDRGLPTGYGLAVTKGVRATNNMTSHVNLDFAGATPMSRALGITQAMVMQKSRESGMKFTEALRDLVQYRMHEELSALELQALQSGE